MPYLLCWGISELGEVSSCPRALRGVWLDVVSRGGPDEGSANEDMLETDVGTIDSDVGFTGTAEPAAARKVTGIFNKVAQGLFTTRELTIIASKPTENNIRCIISTFSSNVISCYKCSSSLKLDGFWLLKLVIPSRDCDVCIELNPFCNQKEKVCLDEA